MLKLVVRQWKILLPISEVLKSEFSYCFPFPNVRFYLEGLDVFINSAGILMNGSTETLSLDDYDKCMTINTRSAFVLTQSVLPHLLKSKGSIVNVSSVTGKYVSTYVFTNKTFQFSFGKEKSR